MESSRPGAGATMTEPQSSSGFRPAVTTSVAVNAATPEAPSPGAQVTPVQQVPAYRSSYQSPSGYRVQQGDTLWSLADSMRPDQSVSIEQMMLAMLRSNPEAFINENVNGLKRGYILRIPDRDDIVTMNQAEAVAIVREQNALWREYQQAVTAAEPGTAMATQGSAGEGIGLDTGDEARLEIVAAGSGQSASGTKDPGQMSESELRAELAIARESLETERVEKEELQQRVGSLEGQVDRMKSLLTLEDTDMAEMQQAATPTEADAMPDVDAAEDIMLDEQVEALVDEAGLEESAAVEDLGTAEEAIDEAVIEETDAEQVFIDETQPGEEQVEMSEELVELPAAPSEDFTVAPSTEPAFMQPQKKGPLAALLDNPVLLSAAGGGLLLVLVLIALIVKRRKTAAEGEPALASNLDDIVDQIDETDTITEIEAQQPAQEMAEAEIAAEAEPDQEVPEVDSAAVAADVEDTEVPTPKAEPEELKPRDDIIAEADVYLAYGIYQQAEELLQNALKNNPDKDSYRVKLAETYFAGKNSDGFIELATEMNQNRGGEDTPAWQQVVAIGQQFVPDHELFKGASAGDLNMDDMASSPEPEDADIASEGTQEDVAPDLDLAFDESEAGIVEGATAESFEPAESVEFDIKETGVETTPETGDDLEFGLEETQAFEADQTAEEFSLDIDAEELGIEDEAETKDSSTEEFDLDLSADLEETLAPDDEAEDAGLSLDDVNEASLEFDVDEAEVDAATEVEAPAEVEAATEVEAAAETVVKPSTPADSFDDDVDLSDLDDIDEVSTKLDLAKAYLDMGDADGTRSILDEVMTEGNDDQKKEADELLRQLG